MSVTFEHEFVIIQLIIFLHFSEALRRKPAIFFLRITGNY